MVRPEEAAGGGVAEEGDGVAEEGDGEAGRRRSRRWAEVGEAGAWKS